MPESENEYVMVAEAARILGWTEAKVRQNAETNLGAVRNDAGQRVMRRNEIEAFAAGQRLAMDHHEESLEGRWSLHEAKRNEDIAAAREMRLDAEKERADADKLKAAAEAATREWDKLRIDEMAARLRTRKDPGALDRFRVAIEGKSHAFVAAYYREFDRPSRADHVARKDVAPAKPADEPLTPREKLQAAHYDVGRRAGAGEAMIRRDRAKPEDKLEEATAAPPTAPTTTRPHETYVEAQKNAWNTRDKT